MAGLGAGEGSLTAAMVIPLARVVACDRRRAEWADVVWLALRVHVGNVGEGGVREGRGDVIDFEGEDVDARPAPRGLGRKPPPPPDTAAPPPKAPRKGTPAKHAAHERAGGDVAQQSHPWQVGRSLQTKPSGTWSSALLEPRKTSGPLKCSVTPWSATATS